MSRRHHPSVPAARGSNGLPRPERSRPEVMSMGYSRAIGGVFFTGFGAFWIAFALVQLHWLCLATGVVILLGTGWLGTLIGSLFRQTLREPRAPQEPDREKRFNCINAAQWCLIGAGFVVLPLVHGQAFVMSMIASIVGVHLIPLASVLRQPFHYVTATLILLWVIGCLLFVSVPLLTGMTGLGTGLILWFSAAVNLLAAQRILRTFKAGDDAAVVRMP